MVQIQALSLWWRLVEAELVCGTQPAEFQPLDDKSGLSTGIDVPAVHFATNPQRGKRYRNTS